MTSQSNSFVSCHLIVQALSLLCNGCVVLPLGATLLLQIQHTFNDCITNHMRKGSSIWHQRVFWDSAKICLTNHLRHDFKALHTLLTTGGSSSTTWTWPIGLLIPRESQFTFFSDASHEGLGGWCPQLCLMWRITKAELVTLGFTMAASITKPRWPWVPPPRSEGMVHALAYISLVSKVMDVLVGGPMILVRARCGNARAGTVKDMVRGQLVSVVATRRGKV